MKKTTFCLLLAALLCAALPASAQKSWTSPYSGITHKGRLAPWVYEVKTSAKQADLSRKIHAWLVTIGYDAKAANNEVFQTADQIKRFPKTVKESNFKKFLADCAKSPNKDLMRTRFSQLQKAMDKSEVFGGYSLTAQMNVDFATLSEADFEYLKKFFSAPAKDRTPAMSPQQAFQYKNGVIYLTLLNKETRAFNPIFLLVNPEEKTVTFIYNDPVFDRTLLQGKAENLLED